MGQPNPQVLAQWIENESTNLEFVSVRTLLEPILRRRNGNASDEEIAEWSEQLETATVAALELRAAEYRAEGVRASYEVSVEGPDAYFKAVATPESDLLIALRSMSPRGFEHFCKEVVIRLNGTSVVEGGTQDGGVDFYGFGLPAGGDCGPAPLTSQIVVIGQAKRYNSNNLVSETQIREFIGGALCRAHDLRLRYADRFGILTPVLLAFWSTGDFHFGAKKYARQMGVWYLNGKGFSQLAMRAGLGVNDVPRIDENATRRAVTMP